MTARCWGALALLGLGGCADDFEGLPQLTTYNVGLGVGFIDEADARTDPVIDAIEGLEADVVCLQGLWVEQTPPSEDDDDAAPTWTTETIELVLEETEEEYPYSYWSRTTAAEDNLALTCSLDEELSLLECLQTECSGATDLADCASDSCSSIFMGVSEGCRQCMRTNTGNGIEGFQAGCVGQGSGGIQFDGHNGLALLSKTPLENTEIEELPASLTARAVLHAQTDLPDIGLVDLYCTQLASNLAEVVSYPDDGPYSSFEEENRAQTDAVLAFADQRLTENAIILGSFGHGPEFEGVQADLPANYDTVTEQGYNSAGADAEVGCSFCAENTLVLGSGEAGNLVDHVYTSLTGYRSEYAVRELDERLEIYSLVEEAIQTSNLAPHYAVTIRLWPN